MTEDIFRKRLFALIGDDALNILKEVTNMIDEARKEFPLCEDCQYLDNNFRRDIELPSVEDIDNGCTRNLKGLIEDCPRLKWYEKWFGK